MVDAAQPREAMAAFGELHKGRSPAFKANMLVRSIVSGRRFREQQQLAVCEAADRLADRLGLSAGVRRGLEHVYTRWDGKGLPPLSGERIAISARVVRLCHLVEVFVQVGGPETAIVMVKKRRGVEFDPAIARVFLQHSDELLAQITTSSVWDLALNAEPDVAPARRRVPDRARPLSRLRSELPRSSMATRKKAKAPIEPTRAWPMWVQVTMSS